MAESLKDRTDAIEEIQVKKRVIREAVQEKRLLAKEASEEEIHLLQKIDTEKLKIASFEKEVEQKRQIEEHCLQVTEREA